MPLQIQSLSSFVSAFVSGVQGAAKALVDFTIGSINLAVAEANAAVASWLQQEILAVLATTRASTSNGQTFNTNAVGPNGNPLSDLDGWMADFGFTRLPAIGSTGQVTFSRFSTGQQAVVLVGTVVQTSDGTQTYTVILDTTNAAYNAGLGGYVIAPNASSVSVTVVATNAGVQGNAASGAINTLGQAITYVDTVTNASPFADGVDQETDAAFRTRFVTWLSSLSKATYNAIAFTLESMGNVPSYQIIQNYDYSGAWAPGTFYIVASDGTTSPSPGFLSNIYDTLFLAVRAMTVQFSVVAPTAVTANVGMTLTTTSSYTHSTVVGIVQAALQTYINGLGVGNGLSYMRLAQVAFDASPGVTDVTAMTLNGGTSDLAATVQQMIWAGTVNVE